MLNLLSNRYFRHASGEMYVISQALAKFISINRSDAFFFAAPVVSILWLNSYKSVTWIGRSILRTYAHDDVSAGSWFIGLDVKHVDEGKFCCSSWSSGLSLSLSICSCTWAHIHSKFEFTMLIVVLDISELLGEFSLCNMIFAFQEQFVRVFELISCVIEGRH